MKVYQTTTQYNCGIDLHARCMYICVMNKEAKHGRRRANRIIAHKMGRAVYTMLKRKEVFNYDKFLGKYKKRCQPTKTNKKEIREMVVSL